MTNWDMLSINDAQLFYYTKSTYFYEIPYICIRKIRNGKYEILIKPVDGVVLVYNNPNTHTRYINNQTEF